MKTPLPNLQWRQSPAAHDIASVGVILDSNRQFNREEIEMAKEIVRIRLAQGKESGYDFEFCSDEQRLLGFGCFGPIPGTLNRFDVYWIAVLEDCRGMGIGTRIMARMETAIAAQHGEAVFIETSSRDDYALTRAFYLKHGYHVAAVIPNYYRDHDDKVIFMKRL